MIFFTFLTAASAKPFDLGLYGDETSCLMLFSLHHCLNGPVNWGPPSDLIIAGQPRLLNQSLNVFVTVLVDVVCNCLYKGKPDHLSTHRRCLRPPKSKRSRPTWAIGAPKALDGGSVTLGLAGWEGRRVWHSWQEDVMFLMSLFIPCQ